MAGTEVIGGALLILDLLTRPAAAAMTTFAANAIFVTAKMGGFIWSTEGCEYAILLTLA